MSYEYSLVLDEFMGDILAMNSIGILTNSIVGIAAYLFTALSLFALANNRGIRKAWLAWVPVVNVWILGSLSDQYRYVARGQIKSTRKILVVLAFVRMLLNVVVIALGIAVIGNAFFTMINHASEQVLFSRIMRPMVTMLGMMLPLLGIAIGYAVAYYMALYDVYTSCDPRNNVIYLVLSIIPGVSTVALPLLLFLCRNKDEGMPPRRETAPTPEQPVWERPQEQVPVWEQPKSEKAPWEDMEA